jgi:hypothetical protein
MYTWEERHFRQKNSICKAKFPGMSGRVGRGIFNCKVLREWWNTKFKR